VGLISTEHGLPGTPCIRSWRGLLDAYLYCDNATALRVEKGMADWTGTIVGHLADSVRQKMLLCEYGG
jgi:hypothetical protein